ncbi:hypothetical protein HCA00_04785 [Listeria booriae]|uniref:hypothetical protein n=1 Tax=Listeria booriae TaxID=1552123 RepID=UPI00164E2CDA|nr:hypothetical protein [Listeria booriae]MBC6128099.1 hypothetical protein [Listeria booriae]
MGVNIMKAVQMTMGGTKMTHKHILNNGNTKFNFICCKDGKLINEFGEVLKDTKPYHAKDMKTGWEPYRD